jgi:hypothetical protein
LLRAEPHPAPYPHVAAVVHPTPSHRGVYRTTRTTVPVRRAAHRRQPNATDPPRRRRHRVRPGGQLGVFLPPGRQRSCEHVLFDTAQFRQELPSRRVQQHLGIVPPSPFVAGLVVTPLPARPEHISLPSRRRPQDGVSVMTSSPGRGEQRGRRPHDDDARRVPVSEWRTLGIHLLLGVESPSCTLPSRMARYRKKCLVGEGRHREARQAARAVQGRGPGGGAAVAAEFLWTGGTGGLGGGSRTRWLAPPRPPGGTGFSR